MQYSESNVPFFLSPSSLFMIMIKYIACRVQSKCLVSLFEFLRFLRHHTLHITFIKPFLQEFLDSKFNPRLSVTKLFSYIECLHLFQPQKDISYNIARADIQSLKICTFYYEEIDNELL